MPEYGCSPIWLYDGINLVQNLEISELAVSKSLKNAIQSWANTYESTFDDDYPPDSGFANKLDEAAFESAGVLIWEKILIEINSYYNVHYYSILTNEIYETLECYRKTIFLHPNYALNPTSLALAHS